MKVFFTGDYNKKLVEKLSRAARECLALSPVACIIVNPRRQWRG